jgi:3-dehydrosphinganine reductase
MDLSHKLALITGGSSGIGFALAEKLASQGANVWLLARREDRLKQAVGALELKAIGADQVFGYLAADVADKESLFAVLSRFSSEVGTPDILVNSAGASRPGQFEALEPELFEELMRTNYLGTVYTTRAVIRGMINRRSGTIVNISSIAGFIGVYGYSAYGATKYAVRGFSDVLRAEMKPRGIRVSVVFPPDTETPQLAGEEPYKPEVTRELSGTAKPLSATQVADAILRGVSRGRYVITPGLDGSLLFKASNLLGAGIYPLMDYLVRQAMRKHHLPEEA